MPAPAGPGDVEAPEAPDSEYQEGESGETQVALADLPKGDSTKVGDTVPMEVTAVDTENGTATIKCSVRPTSMSGGGIKKMAAAFDEPMEG